MSINEMRTIERIRANYMEEQPTKLDELKALDKKVRRPAQIFAYTFGTVGSLVLGTGMCFAMKVIGAGLSFAMPMGIGVGLVGIAMVTSNYFIYKKMLHSRKKKYANQVLTLSGELLPQ